MYAVHLCEWRQWNEARRINATVYAGITNLFNAYDPYLGMAGRIYRLGMRMTF